MQKAVCQTLTIIEAIFAKNQEPETIDFSFKILNKFTKKYYNAIK